MGSPPKDTPEYDAWRQKISERTKEAMNRPEVRQKSAKGAFQKGNIPHNIGKPMPEETKAKMIASKTGQKQSDETKQKRADSLKARASQRSPEERARIAANISAAKMGKKHSLEHRTNLSIAKKGKPGHSQTEESKAKLSAASQGRQFSEEARRNAQAARKRNGISEETRQKLRENCSHLNSSESIKKRSKALKDRWETATEEQRKIWNDRLAVKESSIEAFIASKFDQYGIVYVRQKFISRYYVDFFLPSTLTIIEVNGCYWHGCMLCGFNNKGHQEKRVKDAKRYETLKDKGYAIEVLWEHDIRKEMGQVWPYPRGGRSEVE